jgi:hypothetical protein
MISRYKMGGTSFATRYQRASRLEASKVCLRLRWLPNKKAFQSAFGIKVSRRSPIHIGNKTNPHSPSERKHMDKHKRPHKCEHPGCTTPAFGDKSTLIRHQREVHDSRNDGRSSGEWCCPAPSCERRSRGFARRWNLLEHCRRMHNSEEQDGKLVLLSNQEHPGPNPIAAAIMLPSPTPQSSPQAPTTTIMNAATSPRTHPQHNSNGHPFVIEMRSGSGKREREDSGYQDQLQAKLRRKEEDRKKLDQEIKVLRDALAIV